MRWPNAIALSLSPLVLIALFAASPAVAQKAKVPVMGILSPHPEVMRPSDGRGVFTGAMWDLGWKEGGRLMIERAFAQGREEQLPALARSLVDRRVDLIVAIGPEAAVAAAQATKTTPIVFWGVGLPVEQGLVDSLARPGRNVTGIAWMAAIDVATKKLELLGQIAPRAKRVAWIETPEAIRSVSGREVASVREDLARAARGMGFQLSEHMVSRREDFDRVFAEIRSSGAQALAVRATMLTWRERARIAEFARTHQLPSAFGSEDYADSGGLYSYGVDWRATMPQTAAMVQKILRGANPAETPVELPVKYDLVINLRTAKALGLKVPPSVLLRADRVIE
ncbi:MAG: ABC transporter substrate-binding protein [Betaproteobacteria bacterium]